MKTLLTLIAFTLFSFNINAQTISADSLKSIYEKKTIYLHGMTGKYIKGNEEKKIGFMGNKLLREFENFPEAQEEFKKFRQKSLTGLILSVVGTVGSYAGFIMFATQQEEYMNPALGLILGSGVAAFIGGQQTQSAQKHFHKAIWLYNRDVLLKGAK